MKRKEKWILLKTKGRTVFQDRIRDTIGTNSVWYKRIHFYLSPLHVGPVLMSMSQNTDRKKKITICLYGCVKRLKNLSCFQILAMFHRH